MKLARNEVLEWPMRCLHHASSDGEAVGVLAAQSVGEATAQMTLNTFHMAGAVRNSARAGKHASLFCGAPGRLQQA